MNGGGVERHMMQEREKRRASKKHTHTRIETKISSNRHRLYGLLVNKTYQSPIIGNATHIYTSKFLSHN